MRICTVVPQASSGSCNSRSFVCVDGPEGLVKPTRGSGFLFEKPEVMKHIVRMTARRKRNSCWMCVELTSISKHLTMCFSHCLKKIGNTVVTPTLAEESVGGQELHHRAQSLRQKKIRCAHFHSFVAIHLQRIWTALPRPRRPENTSVTRQSTCLQQVTTEREGTGGDITCEKNFVVSTWLMHF